MLFVDVIQKKRDGEELTTEEIEFFVKGLADSSIPSEQVSALAMAVIFRSMKLQQ
jgi:thymidine phosphorylase